MILACPACSTRYAVDGEAIGPAGRRVKCTRCGHVWTAAPDAHLEVLAPAPVRAEPLPRPDTLPPEPLAAPERRRSGGAGWAVLVLLLAALAAILYIARADIVRLWPPAGELYRAIGVPVPGAGMSGELGDGLTFEEVTGSAGPEFRVTGKIVNRSGARRPLPPIELRLFDASDGLLASWTFDPEPDWLVSGEILQFETALPNPPAGATRLDVVVVTE